MGCIHSCTHPALKSFLLKIEIISDFLYRHFTSPFIGLEFFETQLQFVAGSSVSFVLTRLDHGDQVLLCSLISFFCGSQIFKTS